MKKISLKMTRHHMHEWFCKTECDCPMWWNKILMSKYRCCINENNVDSEKTNVNVKVSGDFK